MSLKCNATQIKYAMAFLMVLDHLPHIPGLVPPFLAAVIHALTRCVAAWFAYAAVEGFSYTHNLRAYLIRLWGWALVMGFGNAILNLLTVKPELAIYNNIFLTLALGVTLLSLAFPRQKRSQPMMVVSWLVVIFAVIAGSVLTEGGMVILPFMLITYGARKHLQIRNSLYGVLAIFLFLSSYTAYPTWQATLEMTLYNSDWLFISILPVLAIYNGKRGPKTAFNKYFFYVFYPAHLWLITLIAYLVSR